MLDLMIQRYSLWYALEKGVAWVLQFKYYIRRIIHSKREPTVELDVPHPPEELSVENWKSAEKLLIKLLEKSVLS